MPHPFTPDELAARRAATIASMQTRGLSGLLMFHQVSMYHLTGYDTGGYAFFQCLFMHADGRVALLTRAPDLRQAQYTSDIEDIRIWVDRAGMNPADDLRDLLEEHGCRNATLGIEWDSHGLTAHHGRNIEAAMAGFCRLEDASVLVTELRAVKSPAELDCMRRAAELADVAYEAALDAAHPGAFDGDILAAMQASMFRGDGDFGGMDNIVGSGPGALLLRYHSGRRHLDPNDQLTLEFCGVYRRYHSGLMRTVAIGRADADQERMHAVCHEALTACMEALRPGHPVGEVYDGFDRVMTAAGMREHTYNACGYGLGAAYGPSWVDPPWFYQGNEVVAVPNMVFFPQVMLMNSDTQRAMTLGQTVLVTDNGCEALNRAPLELMVR